MADGAVPMNAGNADSETRAFDARDAERTFRAIQVALICVTLGLAYFDVRLCLAIPKFKQIFADMLEGQAFSMITMFVLSQQSALLGLSLLAPLGAIATLFMRPRALAFYVIASAALLAVVQTSVICTALTQPLFSLTDQLGNAK